MKLLVLLALSSLAAPGSPDPAPLRSTSSAEECGYCYDTGDGRHFAVASLSLEADASEGHGWHFYTWSGNCLPHGICVIVVTEATTPSEVTQKGIDAVDQSAVEALVAMAQSPAVSLNPERMSVQILACDGVSVVGHVPLSTDLFHAVQTAIEAS
jgi:hypothetical protein